MKHLKPALAALLLALGLDSGIAGAVAFNPVSTLNFGGGYSATFADNFNSTTPQLSFSDYFVFTLPGYVSGSGASNAIAGINITLNGVVPTVQLSNFELDTVTGNGNGTYNVGGIVANGTLLPFGSYPNALASLSFSNLSMGTSYALNIAGKVTNSNSTYASSGSYSGNVQLNPVTATSIVATVPEPGEWALMLSGFGFLGLIARRQRRIFTGNVVKGKFIGSMLVMGMLGANGAQAALTAAGNGLVYDSVANVTWSSDANLLGTMMAADPNLVSKIIAAVPTVHDTPNAYDNAGPGNYNLSVTDFGSAGTADWFGQQAFMGYLNRINYLGHNTWMQPTTYDQTCLNAYNCTNSMLGELFYTGLGGTAGTNIIASHNANFNLFTNVQNVVYWSGTEYTSFPHIAWNFGTFYGSQGASGKNVSSIYSWAVLPGNAATVAAVPEPGEWMMMLSGFGLLGMVGRKARRR